MDDITAFIAARLDEDEAAAKDVRYVWPTDFDVALNPARVLREVEAKRAIVAEYTAFMRPVRAGQSIGKRPGPGLEGAVTELERVVKLIAAVYSDHSDYKQSWANGLTDDR